MKLLNAVNLENECYLTDVQAESKDASVSS